MQCILQRVNDLSQVPEMKYRTPKKFFFPQQVSYDGELHKHPQLEADLTAVREIYGPNAVSLRYGAGLSVLWNLECFGLWVRYDLPWLPKHKSFLVISACCVTKEGILQTSISAGFLGVLLLFSMVASSCAENSPVLKHHCLLQF